MTKKTNILETLRTEPKHHELRDFFKQHGVKQQSLARLIGVSQCTISEVLRGVRRPSPHLEKELDLISDAIRRQGGF